MFFLIILGLCLCGLFVQRHYSDPDDYENEENEDLNNGTVVPTWFKPKRQENSPDLSEEEHSTIQLLENISAFCNNLEEPSLFTFLGRNENFKEMLDNKLFDKPVPTHIMSNGYKREVIEKIIELGVDRRELLIKFLHDTEDPELVTIVAKDMNLNFKFGFLFVDNRDDFKGMLLVSPLHLAIARGDAILVTLLLKMGACLHCPHSIVPPLLFNLLQELPNMEKIHSLLLEHGADPLKEYSSAEVVSHRNAVLRCCLLNEPKLLKMILKAAPSSLSHFTINAPLPIIYAIKEGAAKIVDCIIRAVDLNQKVGDDYKERNPRAYHSALNMAIHLLARVKSFDTMARLILKGADVNKDQKTYDVPFLYLLERLPESISSREAIAIFINGGLSFNKFSREFYANNLGLDFTFQRNEMDSFLSLLRHGADPNCCDLDGTPLLHLMLRHAAQDFSPSHFEFFQILLEHGADPEIECPKAGTNAIDYLLYLCHSRPNHSKLRQHFWDLYCLLESYRILEMEGKNFESYDTPHLDENMNNATKVDTLGFEKFEDDGAAWSNFDKFSLIDFNFDAPSTQYEDDIELNRIQNDSFGFEDADIPLYETELSLGFEYDEKN